MVGTDFQLQTLLLVHLLHKLIHGRALRIGMPPEHPRRIIGVHDSSYDFRATGVDNISRACRYRISIGE